MVETFEQYKNNLDDISGIFLSCNLFAGRSKPSLLWNRNNGYWADYYVCIVRAEVFRWPCKVMVSLTIESIPNFEGMIADLKAGLKNGY
jgi:hypothetical protein